MSSDAIQYEEPEKHPVGFAKHDVKVKKRKHRGYPDRSEMSVQVQGQERPGTSLQPALRQS